MKPVHLFIFVLSLLFSMTSLSAQHRTDSEELTKNIAINPVDREIGLLLQLQPQQLLAYSEIMKQQRPAYLSAEIKGWKLTKSVYEETLVLLSPILHPNQLKQFSEMMGCLMEQSLTQEFAEI